jgi:peptidoglycan hydrolase CwlO-like protein
VPEWALVQLTIAHVVTNLGCRRAENRVPPEPRQEAHEQQQAAAGDLTQIQAKLASAREEIAALAQRREQAKAQMAAAQQELTALAKRLGDQSI